MEQGEPPSPQDDAAERAELIAQIKQRLREIDEIESELKKQCGNQPLH